MKNIRLLLLFTVIIFSCSDEPYGDTTNDNNSNTNTSENFFPSNGYWKYSVNNQSENFDEMNYLASDSIYIDEEYENHFSLSANEGSPVNGSMNRILTNGYLYPTPTTLTFDGTLDTSDLPLDIGLNNFDLSNITILDLEASEGEIMFVESGNYSNSFNIQENDVPIDISYEISTSKINMHENININETSYENVFQGKLVISVSVYGTFSIFGISQNIPIIENQEIIVSNYYFAESIGLIKSETLLGFEISPELTTLVNLIGGTFDIPNGVSVINEEMLVEYISN